MIKDKQGLPLELRDAFKDLPMVAEADLAGAQSNDELRDKINAILAKLRTAGLLSS